jgi:small subunit ribosomal protein S1
MQSDIEEIENTEQSQLQSNGDNGADEFEEMLDEHGPKPLRRGQTVEGEIIKLEDNLAIVDVGAKRDAIVSPEEMGEVDEEFLDSLDEGDNVYVYVVRTPLGDEELLVSLEKGLREQDWQLATEYLDNQEAVELRVTGKNKGGLLVEFGRLQGFVPTSHVPRLQRLRNQGALAGKKAELVGEEMLLKVIEVDRQRRRLVLSAKKAQKEIRRQRLLELEQQVGETITGQITNLVSFGAFIELGGLEGLIHISEIAWQKVDDPAEWLTPGEEIEVAILSVDVEKERVSLSRKALLPSPWETFDEKHSEGELVEGEVTNVVDFGAFVLVSEGIEGLIHVSEMRGTWDADPQEVLYPGDVVLARILQIDPERERLSLSQRRVRQDEEIEWIGQRQQQQLQQQQQLLDEEE